MTEMHSLSIICCIAYKISANTELLGPLSILYFNKGLISQIQLNFVNLINGDFIIIYHQFLNTYIT